MSHDLYGQSQRGCVQRCADVDTIKKSDLNSNSVQQSPYKQPPPFRGLLFLCRNAHILQALLMVNLSLSFWERPCYNRNRKEETVEDMFIITKGFASVTKTIRIPEPVAEKLEKLAAENNISFNQLVNQCIVFALESREEPDVKLPETTL